MNTVDPFGRKTPGGPYDPPGNDVSKYNCFGYCFGENSFIGVGDKFNVIYADKDGNATKWETLPLCSTLREIKILIGDKAKGNMLTSETSNTNCCCDKNKVCVFTQSEKCLDMTKDQLRPYIYTHTYPAEPPKYPDPVTVQFLKFTPNDMKNIKLSNVDTPQHCAKCKPSGNPGEPANWSEKMCDGPIKDTGLSSLPNAYQNGRLWKCFESPESAKVSCNTGTSK